MLIDRLDPDTLITAYAWTWIEAVTIRVGWWAWRRRRA